MADIPKFTDSTHTTITSATATELATFVSAAGASIANLSATNLASGTLPSSVFPAALPVANGVNLTNLNGSQVTTGQVPAANGGTGLSTLTSGAILTGNGTGNVALVGPGTTGQIPISNGTTIAMTTVGTDASINSSGALTIANLAVTNAKIANSTINLTTKVTGTLPETNGGTNQSTYTQGDTLYASGTNALSKLSIGTQGKVLSSSGTIPQWSYGIRLQSISTNTTLTTSDAGSLIRVTGARTITLPKCSTVGAGWACWIENADPSTATTIKTNATTPDTVSGADVSSNGIVLTSQYAKMGFVSDGTSNWTVIDCNGDFVQASFSLVTWAATSGDYGDCSGNSITLTAGEWDINALVSINPNATTRAIMGIGTAAGNSTSGLVQGDSLIELVLAATCASGQITYRVAITTPTTYWLKQNYTYTVAPTVFGRISGRRFR